MPQCVIKASPLILKMFSDTIENLPDEVQREISTMRELDVRYQGNI